MSSVVRVSVCRIASCDLGHIPCLLANTCFPRNGSENGPRPYFAACPFSTPGMFHPRLFRLVGFFQFSLGILSIKVARYSSVFLLHILVTTPSSMLDPFQILHRFPKFTGVTLYPLWCPLPHQGQGLEARASHTRTTEFRREKLQSQDHLSNPHQPSAKILIDSCL